MPKYSPVFILLVVLIFTGACSGHNIASENPLIPQLEANHPIVTSEPTHFLLSYNWIAVDPSRETLELVPARQVSFHLNILKFLEGAPCSDCLKLSDYTPGNPMSFQVSIEHPFDNANLTGFDMRGVIMFDAGYNFPVYGLNISDWYRGTPELLNADGFTALYNPTTAGAEPTGLLSYIKGNKASPEVPDSLVNAYKRFISNDPANIRNAIFAGDTVSVEYIIGTNSIPFNIGYAVDVCWAPPIVDPVIDPITDFPPEANCMEPWKISVSEEPVGDGLTSQGGMTKLVLDIYDWQGRESHFEPQIECPDLFTGTLTADWVEDGNGFSKWEGTISNDKLAISGFYPVLISVRDKDDLSAPEWLDLTSYQVYKVFVNGGWVRTWGNYGSARAIGVTLDESGNIFLGGEFHDCDLDPGPGEEIHYINSEPISIRDLYCLKLNSQGLFDWAETWGGQDAEKYYGDFGGWCTHFGDMTYVTGALNEDGFIRSFDQSGSPLAIDQAGMAGTDVKTDSSGNIYWTGEEAFLRKLAPDGSLLLDLSWGNYPPGIAYARGLALDNENNVYVTGWWAGTVDFDPGPGEFILTSSNPEWIEHWPASDDVFLIKFDSAGNFQWVVTFGAMGGDTAYDVALDDAGNPYLTGCFQLTVDFDPGPGIDEHNADGGNVYLAKFNPDGIFQWVHTWEGAYALALAVDESDNNLYVAGKFFADSTYCLKKFDSSGKSIWDYQSQSDNGGPTAWGVAVDQAGYVFVAGEFYGTYDFCPGPGIDERDAYQNADSAFLVKLRPDGTW
jgi:DNA-binding beta-propeller fold protein YncE